MLKLALRNILRQKLRTGMTLAAIIFGVLGLVLSGGFVQDVYHQLGEALIHSQTGHLQISRAGYHAQGTRSPEKFLVEQPESAKRLVMAQPKVDDVMERIYFSGLLNNGRTDWPVIGEGVEPQKESRLGTHVRIIAGRQLGQSDRYGAMLGEGVAQALKAAPGDRLILVGNTLEGALNNVDLEVAGIFQSFSKDYDARAVRIPLQAAQEFLGTTGVNSIVVSLKRTDDTELVARNISRNIDNKLEVKTWKQLNDFYENTVALYERQFGVLQFIILVLVLLSVANSVNMSVFERVGEFGTMMSLGNRRGQIFRLILTESVLLGLIGSGLGVMLGVMLALVISAVGIPMPPPPNANVGYTAQIQIIPMQLLLSFVVGLTAAVLAALLPAARVSRTPVVEALRSNV